jgi:hypothetical protein
MKQQKREQTTFGKQATFRIDGKQVEKTDFLKAVKRR